MEHRLKKRYRLSVDVVVQGLNGLVMHGKSRDISADGMFIQLVPPQAMLINTAVDIELPCGGCWHGWVVHIRDEGIGLMFRAIGSLENNLLDQLLAEKSAA